MVEQLDTETFTDSRTRSAQRAGAVFEPVPGKHFSPPLLTRTWFHQGPVDDDSGDWQAPDWSTEYWPGDPPALMDIEEINRFLYLLADPRDRRDALRTLRGSTLRTELYALDGSDRQNRPYTVTEQAFGLREESAPEPGDLPRRRIFFPHPVAQRTTQWERGDEPMTRFAFTGDYDTYGQARRQVSLAVPRHRDYRAPAPAGAPYLGTLAQSRYALRDDAERFVVNRVCESSSFEILNDGSLPVHDLYREIQSGQAATTLFGHTFNYYDGEAFVGLPYGELGEFGALVRSESLVLTEEILRDVYRDPAEPVAAATPPYLGSLARSIGPLIIRKSSRTRRPPSPAISSRTGRIAGRAATSPRRRGSRSTSRPPACRPAGSPWRGATRSVTTARLFLTSPTTCFRCW